MAITRRHLIEYSAVAVVITGMALFILPAVQNARDPRGPLGSPIPTEPPDEANRFEHPSGLSIVLPENWVSLPDLPLNSPSLQIVPRFGLGRHPAGIGIQTNVTPPVDPVAEGFRPLTFQRSEAYEKCEVTRESTFDDPAHWCYTCYVRRGEQWHMMTYGYLGKLDSLPEMARKYLETIRFPAAERLQSVDWPVVNDVPEQRSESIQTSD